MKKGKYIVVVTLLLAVFTGCKRTQDDYVGPGLGYASKDFAVLSNLSISADSIDFKNNPKLDFTAKFNEKVAYTITIKGAVSGGIKHLQGFSDHIATSWIGNSELFFFKNEICTIELTVMGKAGVLNSRNIYIIDTYRPSGTLIANMEAGGITCFGDGFWDSYLDPETRTTKSEKILCQPISTIVPNLEGRYSWKSEGIDGKGGGFLGLSYTKPDVRNGLKYNANDFVYNTHTTNSDSLWFNIFIYGTGDTHAAAYIKFMQDDNMDGAHDSKSENGFELQITDLSHTGWKLFSFKYSRIMLGGNSDFGGSGDNIHRPDKIWQIEFALWSLQKGAHVSLIYDYPVFTVGKPFDQQ